MLFLMFFACSSSESKIEIEEPVRGEEDQDETLDLEPPTNGSNTFVHDDLQRLFRIHIPENLSANAPLVIVMHGYTSSAEVIEDYSGMNDQLFAESCVDEFQ